MKRTHTYTSEKGRRKKKKNNGKRHVANGRFYNMRHTVFGMQISLKKNTIQTNQELEPVNDCELKAIAKWML